MTGNSTRLAAFCAIGLLCVCLPFSARAQYHIQDLGPGPFDFRALSYDVNLSGQITGAIFNPSNGAYHAFRWGSNVFQDLGIPGNVSYGLGLNDSGDIAGYYQTGLVDPGTGNPLERAFLYSAIGMIDLGTLGGPNSRAQRINSAGNVVGVSDMVPGYNGFVYSRSRSQLIALGALAAGQPSWARDINDSNQIVGFSFDSRGRRRATLFNYNDSTATVGSRVDLGDFAGTVYNFHNSIATGINNSGHIVGQSETDYYGPEAFIWKSGVMTPIGYLTGRSASFATDINYSDTVVGYGHAYNDDVGNHRAFVYNNGLLTDLNTFIPTGNPDWLFYEATAINDKGQIVVVGRNTWSMTSFVLNPDALPVAAPDSAKTAGNTAVTINVLANDSDADNDQLTVTAITQGAFGAVVNNGNGTVTYTPNTFAGGTDAFKYTLNDGLVGGNATGTVSVTVYAANVSSEISISLGPLKLDHKTGRYTQSALLKNIGTRSIPLPVSLVVDNLSSNATLYNKSGVTTFPAPGGQPYLNITGSRITVLAPGNTVSGTLEFTNPSGAAITYTNRVLAGVGSR